MTTTITVISDIWIITSATRRGLPSCVTYRSLFLRLISMS
jgi:hypothetical protein